MCLTDSKSGLTNLLYAKFGRQDDVPASNGSFQTTLEPFGMKIFGVQ